MELTGRSAGRPCLIASSTSAVVYNSNLQQFSWSDDLRTHIFIHPHHHCVYVRDIHVHVYLILPHWTLITIAYCKMFAYHRQIIKAFWIDLNTCESWRFSFWLGFRSVQLAHYAYCCSRQGRTLGTFRERILWIIYRFSFKIFVAKSLNSFRRFRRALLWIWPRVGWTMQREKTEKEETKRKTQYPCYDTESASFLRCGVPSSPLTEESSSSILRFRWTGSGERDTRDKCGDFVSGVPERLRLLFCRRVRTLVEASAWQVAWYICSRKT